MEAPERTISCGFGPESMKQIKVCPRCASFVSTKLYVCPQCGGRLPQSNLFQLYQRSHRLCPICDTVLSDFMKFCPHCGTPIVNEHMTQGKEGIGK